MPFFHKHSRLVTAWLCLCLALVAAMVLVGGYTRLSGSGLSITEWKPIHGTIPPVNEAEWQEEFDLYRASPQYQKINRGMSMEEFKAIFWPEYWHRVLGRAIGIVFLLPLVFFAFTRSITRRFTWRLTGIFALGGLQGLMGWLMVASGLVDNPYVSHLRLAAHLALAFLIFALILWAILDVVTSYRLPVVGNARPTINTQPVMYIIWFAVLCLQIILGALLAGLHGGLIYNSWPTMNGEWIASGIFDAIQLDNIGLIQFLHRTLAVLVTIGFAFWWFFHRVYVTQKGLHAWCAAVMGLIAIQFLLGVLTLIRHVPLKLGLAHQMTALLLFGLTVVIWHRLVKPRRMAGTGMGN